VRSPEVRVFQVRFPEERVFQVRFPEERAFQVRFPEARASQVAPRQIKLPSFQLSYPATPAEDREDRLNISSWRILWRARRIVGLVIPLHPRRISTHVCREDFHNRPMVARGIEGQPL
jgi:hypothetical protein